MERITFDGNFCDIVMCHNVDGSSTCEKETCDLRRTWERLKEIENILGDDYDLDRLKVLANQRMTMREEVSQRFSLTAKIPLDRLRELVEADRDGRCVVLPCKVGSSVWRVYDDCEFPGDCGTKQKCNGCEYRNIFAEEQAFCLSMLSQNGKLGHPYYTSIEDAESALKGEQHEDSV